MSIASDTTAREDSVVLPVLLAAIAVYMTVAAIYVLGDGLYIHIDGGARLFGALLRGEVFLDPEPPFQQVFRPAARTLEQAPALLAAQLGIDDMQSLRRIYAAALVAPYPLSWVAVYLLLPPGQRHLTVLAILSAFLLGLPNALDFSSEAHVMHAAAWVLFALILGRPEAHIGTARLCAAALLVVFLSGTYESVVVCFALFALMLLWPHRTGAAPTGAAIPLAPALALVALMLAGGALAVSSMLGLQPARVDVLAGRVQRSISLLFFLTPLSLVVGVALWRLGRRGAAGRPAQAVIAAGFLAVLALAVVRAPDGVEPYRILRHWTAWATPSLMLVGWLSRDAAPVWRREGSGALTVAAVALCLATTTIAVRSYQLNLPVLERRIAIQTTLAGCRSAAEVDWLSPGQVGHLYHSITAMMLSETPRIPAFVYANQVSLDMTLAFYADLAEQDGRFFDLSAVPCLLEPPRDLGWD